MDEAVRLILNVSRAAVKLSGLGVLITNGALQIDRIVVGIWPEGSDLLGFEPWGVPCSVG